MKPEKKAEVSGVSDFTGRGVPKEWVPVLQKAGIGTLEALDAVKAGKLFNDICGLNKKLKLGLKNPSMDEVKGWQEGS